MDDQIKNFKIRDYDYITSAIGNAYFSKVTYEQLWNCILLAHTREELDIAITAQIRMNELCKVTV